MILIVFFCCMKILFMFACEVQLNILVQYSRCEWKKLVYKDFRALGVSVCLALLRKNIERDSLLDRAVELVLKFRCSSKYMPKSLKDLRLGLAWWLWMRFEHLLAWMAVGWVIYILMIGDKFFLCILASIVSDSKMLSAKTDSSAWQVFECNEVFYVEPNPSPPPPPVGWTVLVYELVSCNLYCFCEGQAPCFL